MSLPSNCALPPYPSVTEEGGNKTVNIAVTTRGCTERDLRAPSSLRARRRSAHIAVPRQQRQGARILRDFRTRLTAQARPVSSPSAGCAMSVARPEQNRAVILLTCRSASTDHRGIARNTGANARLAQKHADHHEQEHQAVIVTTRLEPRGTPHAATRWNAAPLVWVSSYCRSLDGDLSLETSWHSSKRRVDRTAGNLAPDSSRPFNTRIRRHSSNFRLGPTCS
jgi:hypothetical protein